jgi:hypothetical protein
VIEQPVHVVQQRGEQEFEEQQRGKQKLEEQYREKQ